MSSTLLPRSILACAPTTHRGSAVHLSTNPSGSKMVYTNHRSIIIRDLQNPVDAEVFVGHSVAATVATWSPSGYYIATGDMNGMVKIWDATQPTHILKHEYQPLSGRINDIAWDGESQRILTVGDGRDISAKAFLVSTGSSVGDFSGHSKRVTTCDLRSSRPFKAVTGGDDHTVCFYNGVPFKFGKSLGAHTRFVNEVRYSPSGHLFASVGADGKVVVCDGTTGEVVKELSNAHTGGIYAVSWSPDGSQILTSSADTTTKLWDIQMGSIVNTFECTGKNSGADAQQVGNVWSKAGHMASLALGGELSYLDSRSGVVPIRVVDGHSKGMSIIEKGDKDTTFFTGGSDGKVYAWEGIGTDKVECKQVRKEDGSSLHASQVVGIAALHGNPMSVAMDDSYRVLDSVFSKEGGKLDFHPVTMTSNTKTLFVVGHKVASVRENGTEKLRMELDFNATCAHATSTFLALGGEDGKTRVYSVSDMHLTRTIDGVHPVTAVAITHDGSHLATADTKGRVYPYDLSTGALMTERWVFHTSKILGLAWDAEGVRCASGGLDTYVYVWDRRNPSWKAVVANAHGEAVTGVKWVKQGDSEQVVTVGKDGMMRVWQVPC